MSTRTVTTQTELNQAIDAKVDRIEIRRRTDVDETELEREAREYAEGETPMTDAEIDAAARFHFFGEGEG